ncbi:hypothetical protein C8R45DRAFT_1090755 [Mycena sanguinolenta]|nr:hypothetical protein C8R45DRAFT_1090755 [Mycena sanguinolenta]
MSFNADITIGALLLGTWANSILYAVAVTQAAHYYRHFKHDSWMLKLLVSSVIAIDSVSMMANYASVYLVRICLFYHMNGLINSLCSTQSLTGEILRICRTSIGQVICSYSKKHNRTHVIEQFDPLYLFATGLVAALAQSFLAARYWLLTRNKFVALTLFCFITVAIGGAFACGIRIAQFPEYTNRKKVVIPATTWLITGAVADISIASALLWELRKAKSSFKETRSRLNRLVSQTIKTGTAGASIALAVLVAFLANKESNVPTGIAYSLGPIYCITMLVNLNSRESGKSWSGRATSSGANVENRGERSNHELSEGGNTYGSIHVHRTAMVHIDTAQEFSTGSVKTHPSQGLTDDSPGEEIEMPVTNSASYSSKKKQDLFSA